MRRPPVPPRGDPVDEVMPRRLLFMVPATAAVTFGSFGWRVMHGVPVDLARPPLSFA